MINTNPPMAWRGKGHQTRLYLVSGANPQLRVCRWCWQSHNSVSCNKYVYSLNILSSWTKVSFKLPTSSTRTKGLQPPQERLKVKFPGLSQSPKPPENSMRIALVHSQTVWRLFSVGLTWLQPCTHLSLARYNSLLIPTSWSLLTPWLLSDSRCRCFQSCV